MNNNITVEDIMIKIKEEVERRKSEYNNINLNSNESEIENIEQIDRLSFLFNQESDFFLKDIYEYADFVKYNDIEFVKNIYRGLLNREADNLGLENNLNDLRSGKYTKSDLVTKIRFSKEGRQKNIKLLGSKKRLFVYFLKNIPFIGNFIEFFINIFTLSKKLRNIRAYEAYNNMRYNEILYKNTIIVNSINDKIDKINNVLKTKINKIEFEKLNEILQNKVDKSQVREIYNQITEVQNEIKEDIKELAICKNEFDSYFDKKLFDYENLKKEVYKINQNKFDQFYVDFEDKFRGSTEEIKERLKIYIPCLESLSFEKDKTKIIDLGCGRGEWLELLKEKLYTDITGVDINKIMIKINKDNGNNVIEYDIIEFLKKTPENSVNVITGFHIVEHLGFEKLMELIGEVYRVLKKDGIVIFETPNPENLIVGACNFYTDPTHERPIVPSFLKYLLEINNYYNIEIIRIHRLMDSYNILSDNEIINNYLLNEMDYGIIGFKK